MNARQILAIGLLATFLALSGCGGGNPPSGTKADRTPDAFGFEPVANANPGQFYEASITIAGLDDGEIVPANLGDIVGEEFALLINGVEQDNHLDRTVENGDVVTVRFNAPSALGETASGEFFAGEPSVSAVFSVTTKAEITAPELAVHFPPLYSMTDVPLPGGIIRLRGTISDDKPGVSMFVNGAQVAVDAASGTWAFEYQVHAGENVVELRAEDTSNNVESRLLSILHVDDRMTAVEFGSGDRLAGIESALWDSARSKLMVGTHELLEIDLASGIRTAMTPYGEYGLLHDVANNRYLGASFNSGVGGESGHGVFSIDPETATATPLSVKNDGGPVEDFHLVNDLAVTADGRRLFAHIWAPLADVDAQLWEIVSDPESASFGTRAVFSDEGFRLESGLLMDEARNRLLIGDCDLKALPLDAPAGTFTAIVIAAAEDFCIQELLVDGDVAWARHVDDGEDRILKVDLETGAYSIVSDLKDSQTGPTTLLDRGMKIGVDAEKRLLFFPLSGESGQPVALAVVDAVSSHRVIVAQSN